MNLFLYKSSSANLESKGESDMDRNSLLHSYMRRLREALEIWGASPPSILEIEREIECHVAEALREQRPLTDILDGLGPVDQLAEAYGTALVLKKKSASDSSRFQRVLTSLGSKLWLLSSAVILLPLAVITVSAPIIGVIGVVSSITLPFLPPHILEPTLRAGLPQLVLLLLSLMTVALGVQSYRWLKLNIALVRTNLWRNREHDLSPISAAEEKQLGLRLVDREFIKKTKIYIVCMITGMALLSAVPPVSAADSGPRIFELELPTGEITSVKLHMGNGQIVVSPSSDRQIRIRLEAKPKPFTDDEGSWNPFSWFLSSRLESHESLMQALDLESSVAGELLTIRPTPRGSSREDRVVESWIVELPTHLHLDLDANSGKVEINGIAGGIRVRQGYGDIEVNVPHGSLDIEVEVGSIQARSGAEDWRQLVLRSTVGNTRVWVDGRRMDYPDPPGAGSRISLEGRGEEIFTLQVEVGDAEIRFESIPVTESNSK